MDLLERTRIVIDLLTGSDGEDLARSRGLDPEEIETWLRAFLEGGITALDRMQFEDAGSGNGKVIPLFELVEPEGKGKDHGHAEQR